MISNQYDELMNSEFDVREFILKNFVQANFEINYKKIEQSMPQIAQIQSQTCEDIASSVDNNLEDYVEISTQLTSLQSQLDNLTLQFSNITDIIVLTQDNLQQRIYQINVIVENLKLIQNLQYSMKDLRKLINILESVDLSKGMSNYNLLETSELIVKSRQLYTELDKSPHCRQLMQQFDLLQIIQQNQCQFQNLLEKEFVNCLQNFNSIKFACILRSFQKMQLNKTPEKLLVQFLLKPAFDLAFSKLNKNLLTKDTSNLEQFLQSVLQIYENNIEIAKVETETFSFKNILVELLYIYLSTKECVNIYSLGVLDLFQQNYQNIQNVKQTLKVNFEKGSEVEKKFMEKWNLQTYFSMRQAEIIKKLEQELQNQLTNNEYNFHLVLQNIIENCFSQKVYISLLKQKFNTLAIQIITRFCNFIKTNKNQIQIEKIPFLINNLSKINLSQLQQDIIVLQLDKIKLVISELIDIAIVQIKIECQSNLEPFSGIPAKFRMTNRDMPNQPSNFCINIFKPLQNYLLKLDDDSIKKLTCEKVCNTTLERFQVIKKQALDTCDKNEELMAKMGVKKNDALDNQKIRMQFQLDEEEIKNIMITKLYQ
ncbi:unnamed protein product [Paramecium primaurelia]|uniref:Conserved oligomeric Golgi complex subunit 2 n=1 Tax=Paramecium primaurelia TaxID=5886 RepID=A0A8S1KRE5_PARPR|nr:unnamed protein product [Paramecium primaurelia]